MRVSIVSSPGQNKLSARGDEGLALAGLAANPFPAVESAPPIPSFTSTLNERRPSPLMPKDLPS